MRVSNAVLYRPTTNGIKTKESKRVFCYKGCWEKCTASVIQAKHLEIYSLYLTVFQSYFLVFVIITFWHINKRALIAWHLTVNDYTRKSHYSTRSIYKIIRLQLIYKGLTNYLRYVSPRPLCALTRYKDLTRARSNKLYTMFNFNSRIQQYKGILYRSIYNKILATISIFRTLSLFFKYHVCQIVSSDPKYAFF